MPIDASIPLSVRPAQQPSMSDLIGNAYQIRALRDQEQERQRQQQEAESVRHALTASGGNVEKALPAITAASPQTGLALRKQVIDWKKADMDYRKAALEFDTVKVGKVASAFAGVKNQADYDAALRDLQTHGLDSPEIPRQYDKATVERYMTQSLSYKERLDEARKDLDAQNKASEPKVVGNALVKPDGTVIYAGEKPETRSLAQQANEANKRHDTEEYKRLLQVIKDTGQADDRPPVTFNLGNQTIPGDFEKTGPEFLASIPAQWRKTVEKIANYDEDPTKVASMRSGMREALTAWVNQVNPEYDWANAANQVSTEKAFTTGTQGQQIQAVNTAISHLGRELTLITQMDNGSFVPGNKLFNELRTMFGSEKVTNFETVKEAVAAEIDSVLAKGQATVAGRKAAKELVLNAGSPAQLVGAVKEQVGIMGGKLRNLDYQYRLIRGKNGRVRPLSPESEAILQKHNISIKSEIEQEGAAAADIPADVKSSLSTLPPSPPGQAYTAPDGKRYRKYADGRIELVPSVAR